MSYADLTDKQIQKLIDDAFVEGYLDCVADVARWTDIQYAVWSERLVPPMLRRQARLKKAKHVPHPK